MSRLSDCFQVRRDARKKVLITYAMAGYPNKAGTVNMINGMIEGGADIVEIGFPFSDPLADGKLIQKASTIALGHKMNLDAYFKIVSSVRKSHPKTPLLMMTYANILYSRGYERICKEASDAGLDGFIVPDISPEDSKDYCAAAKKRDLCTVFLVSPNTEKSRLVKIASVSTGFLYMVAVYGTTGLRSKISPYTLKAIREVRKVTGASLPVGAGFGIGSADDAVKYAKAGADGVIIGSAYVRIAESVESVNLKKRTREFTRKVKSRLETVRADLVQ